MLESHDAAQLADAIGYLSDSQLTGPLSMIDQASGRFANASPEVAEARRAFSDARFRHQRSYDRVTGLLSEQTWQAALNAGEVLAATLRKFHREGGVPAW